jgi:hypothetical protein
VLCFCPVEEERVRKHERFNNSHILSNAEDGRAILPESGIDMPFNIRRLSETEDIELGDALLENTNVTYLEFDTEKYTNSSAEAKAKYVRNSKSLQRIRWKGEVGQCEEIICCFLHAIQESTSLKELHISFPVTDGPSTLALENMLMHTQSLRSFILSTAGRQLEDRAVAAVSSGLKRTPPYESSHSDVGGIQRLSPPF